jgi:hypothetical protein
LLLASLWNSLPAGCGSERGRDAGTTIRDSAGVRIVTSGARGQWSDGAGWRLVRDLRIGEVEGSPEYTFNQIAAVAVTSGGTIFVLDRGDQTIKAYDPSGRFVRQFGREGEGPGEFREPNEMVAVRDTLIVYDWRLRRLTVLTREGVVQRTALVEQTVLSGGRLRVLDDTTLVLGFSAGYSMPPQPEREGRFWLVRLSRGGGLRDTLYSGPAADAILYRTEQFLTVFSAPFARGPRWDARSGRLVFGRGEHYVIDQYGVAPERRLKMSIRRTVPPLEAIEADRAAYRRPYENPAFPEEQRKRNATMLRTVTYPSTWPAYHDLRLDASGRVWALLPRHDADTLAAWDVFAPEGDYLGAVTLPTNVAVHLILEEAVYAVARDELGVQSVMRYRIERNP